MTQIHETAYPRLKADPTTQEIQDVYTLTSAEIEFIDQIAKRPTARTAAFLYLKLFQRLGYFVQIKDVPPVIRQYILFQTGYPRPPKFEELTRFDRSTKRIPVIAALRRYLDVRPLDNQGRAWLEHISETAADTRHVVVDIINVMLEELVHHRYELPAFSTLDRLAIQAREKIHEIHFASITNQLDPKVKTLIDTLFKVNTGEIGSAWNLLKREPKKPTNKETRSFLQHIRRLQVLVEQLPKPDIPVPKLKQYRYVARSLDASEMAELKPHKRYALAVIYIRSQFAKTLDDATDMLIRMLQKLDNQARTKLAVYQQEQLNQTDRLVSQLKEILLAYRIDGDDRQRVEAIGSSLIADVDDLVAICDEHLAYAGRNHLPFLLQPYKALRAQLLNCIEIINPQSSSEDDTLIRMIKLLQSLRNNRHEIIQLPLDGYDENDFRWLSTAWKKLVFCERSNGNIVAINRRYLELAVLYAIREELKSGDLFIQHGERYDDYREQLVDDETLKKELVEYGIVTGIEIEPTTFSQKLKLAMHEIAETVDAEFPKNTYAEIVDGRLLLKKPPSIEQPSGLRQIDQLITEHMENISIVDVLIDTERWLQLNKLFRPLIGTESRIDELRPRVISTLFCYGCNLGPTQTARSIRGISRKQVAWLNIKYVTEDVLEQAIVKVINAYNQFELPNYWGSGKHVSADGTKWNLYEQNLISEFHIRYGGYGGIGYYHVSDKFIALFSHFISCGTYEGTHILDGLMTNTSDIRPDTVHGDTQAQSYTVFALSHLLGIKLMPRIRGIKDLVFHKPDSGNKYQHIDRLFTGDIDWQMIETHLPDMLRVTVSIKLGKISASAILRRLGTYSRKNKLYFAFKELGKVIRTMFLLKYVGDIELRQLIQSETNKSEQFNGFAKKLFFGSEGEIAENLRHEQQKIVKYNHLVANLVILHNVVGMSRVLKKLQSDGVLINQEILSSLAPYRLDHINRYGDYILDFRRKVELLNKDFRILDFESYT
ncbi:Tn3 family transposase [Methylomonas koyamae]|uniref:Transposase n=1 Tax=Methylomonas koyamae TaxID=702114 RepID=A0A177NMK0_9GAMM|nr:Tn3 family transposase [Methylomonas koyamae]OAI19081.1 transposase [Methylomonas koyamae]